MKRTVLFLVSFLALVFSADAQFGNALNFGLDMTTTRQVVMPTNSFNFRNSTIECWVRPDGCPNYNSHFPSTLIFGKSPYFLSWGGNGGSGHFPLGFCANYTSGSNGNFYFETTFAVIQAKSNFAVGLWYHLAATFSDTEVKFYINGVLQGTSPAKYNEISIFGSGDATISVDGVKVQNMLTSCTFFDANKPMVISGNQFCFYSGSGTSSPFKSDYFSGSIDEIRIWNYPRTQEQIVSTKDIQLTGQESGLYVYYDFNQGVAKQANPSETTLYDRTSNHINGTLNSFILGTNAMINVYTNNWQPSFAGPTINALAATAIGGAGFTANWQFPFQTNGYDKYSIEIATDSVFNNVVSGIDASNTSTSIRIHNLSPLTTYYYRVHATTADYPGPCSNAVKLQTINLLPQTITLDPIPDKTYGDQFVLNATSSTNNEIVYTENGSSLQITGNKVTIVNGVSTSITAFQKGDDYYANSPSITRGVNISLAVLTIKLIVKLKFKVSLIHL